MARTKLAPYQLYLNLENIDNVTLTSIASGELLKWNGTNWVNNTLSEAGIATSDHDHSGVYLESIELKDDTTPELGGDLNCGTNSVYFTQTTDTGTTIDWSAGNKHAKTLSADVTLTFTAPSGPTNLVLVITQDSTARTITWPSAVKWVEDTEPDYSTVSKTYIFTFYYDGTNYYGTMAGWF